MRRAIERVTVASGKTAGSRALLDRLTNSDDEPLRRARVDWLSAEAAVPVTGRILHISDLHLGHAVQPSEPLDAPTRADSRGWIPRSSWSRATSHTAVARPELELARELLESLGLPLLAVPGNHDIPYVFPTRFTRTREAWERVFGTAQPVYTSDRLAIVGMNSVRPWRQQGGALESIPARPPRVEARACAGGCAAGRGASSPSRRTTLARRTQASCAPARSRPAAARVRRSGARAERPRPSELLSPSGESSKWSSTIDATRSFSRQRAGFGRPRPERRGEAVGFNFYEFDRESISVVTWSWSGRTFAEVGRRVFQRG